MAKELVKIKGGHGEFICLKSLEKKLQLVAKHFQIGTESAPGTQIGRKERERKVTEYEEKENPKLKIKATPPIKNQY